MASIRILHASDLHISVHEQLRSAFDRLGDLDDPWEVSAGGVADKLRVAKYLVTSLRKRMAASSHDRNALATLAEFVYENAKSKWGARGEEITEEGGEKFDAVVITGDIATTGSTDDIDKAEKFLRADYDLKLPYRSRERDYKGPTLSAVTVQILCLPGNHDRFVPARAPMVFGPGGTEFNRLADYSHAPVHPIELTAELPHGRRLKVVVLGADLTLRRFDEHEGVCGWLGQGKAHAHICNSLTRATEWQRKLKKQDEVLCVLWAVHFPPEFPGIGGHSRLLDERKFVEAADRAGVDAVLAGHTHRQLTYRNPSMSFRVFCCGTTTQNEPSASAGGRDEHDPTKGNLFQIITVTADDGGRVELSARDYRYSNAGSRDGPGLMRWSEVRAPLG